MIYRFGALILVGGLLLLSCGGEGSSDGDVAAPTVAAQELDVTGGGDDASNEVEVDVEAVFDDVEAAIDEERWADVIAATTELVKLELDDTDLLAQAYVERGYAHGQLGEWDAEVADASVAIELEPDDADLLARAYLIRSVAYGGLGDLREAVADATAAIELEPDDTDVLASVYAFRARTYVGFGEWDAAVADATAAIELEPDDTNLLALVYVNRSVAYGQLGDLREAVADATAAIELEPDDADVLSRAYTVRALSRASAGEFDAAVADATVALDYVEDPSLGQFIRSNLADWEALTVTANPSTTVTNYIDAYAAVDQDDGIVTDGDLVVIRANLATSDLDPSIFSDSQIRTIVNEACDVIRDADDIDEFRTATLQLWADKSEEEYFYMMSIAGHGMWTACNGEAVRVGLWD